VYTLIVPVQQPARRDSNGATRLYLDGVPQGSVAVTGSLVHLGPAGVADNPRGCGSSPRPGSRTPSRSVTSRRGT